MISRVDVCHVTGTFSVFCVFMAYSHTILGGSALVIPFLSDTAEMEKGHCLMLQGEVVGPRLEPQSLALATFLTTLLCPSLDMTCLERG